MSTYHPFFGYSKIMGGEDYFYGRKLKIISLGGLNEIVARTSPYTSTAGTSSWWTMGMGFQDLTTVNGIDLVIP